MTLLEMSVLYEDSASAICARVRELRAAIKTQADPEEVRRLRRRILALLPLLRESRELAVLTAHYYDHDFRRHTYERHIL